MSDLRQSALTELRHKGVFQPSRAEIAREMRCRLELGCDERRQAYQPTASRH